MALAFRVRVEDPLGFGERVPGGVRDTVCVLEPDLDAPCEREAAAVDVRDSEAGVCDGVGEPTQRERLPTLASQPGEAPGGAEDHSTADEDAMLGAYPVTLVYRTHAALGSRAPYVYPVHAPLAQHASAHAHSEDVPSATATTAPSKFEYGRARHFEGTHAGLEVAEVEGVPEMDGGGVALTLGACVDVADPAGVRLEDGVPVRLREGVDMPEAVAEGEVDVSATKYRLSKAPA